MVSRENNKKAAAALLHEKLQLLRSITNSNAVSKTSIVMDASKYIEDLKQKVERLNQDIATASNHRNRIPKVAVETLPKGFLVKVFSDTSCPGLLVSILQVFEELGLNVLEARVSCTDTFRLQAVGGEDEQQREGITGDVVKQAVLRAIESWNETVEEESSNDQ